jgi:hypothetical protein
MLRVAQTSFSHVYGLVLSITTEVLLKEDGPLAPIWLQAIQQGDQMLQPEALPRRDLLTTSFNLCNNTQEQYLLSSTRISGTGHFLGVSPKLTRLWPFLEKTRGEDRSMPAPESLPPHI